MSVDPPAAAQYVSGRIDQWINVVLGSFAPPGPATLIEDPTYNSSPSTFQGGTVDVLGSDNTGPTYSYAQVLTAATNASPGSTELLYDFHANDFLQYRCDSDPPSAWNTIGVNDWTVHIEDYFQLKVPAPADPTIAGFTVNSAATTVSPAVNEVKQGSASSGPPASPTSP
jgi:hypothetical protein